MVEKRNTSKEKKKNNKGFPYKKSRVVVTRTLDPNRFRKEKNKIQIEGIDIPILSKSEALSQIRKDLPSSKDLNDSSGISEPNKANLNGGTEEKW